ncbi:poly-gamma-glutamate biosynthesis protein PgsC [Terrisporobacter mayombei]|uniref:Capsule biosynthesis protein CapC n=1 Tax=Terrisporobacter mayombei TaxID=1541 RepID=A0ABY9Q1L0_9FIRM|nr:poly-gamma-glutamate biosynthesis protein PgsC [Terrisporobacter mayombei]MCC3867581.1 poly-gamma-glutamate biosynthesis protein PgsC [Terrisporobacter mayombei]WMT81843.1 Capsule biosynthesis protein CapC [Terrisporobacter mayombei]
MVLTDLYVAIILGLTLSLLFQEKFGINPGGLVVPGYLALTMNNPKSLIVILLLSVLTYMIVEFGLNKFIILYGRRRFLAMLLVCMLLKIALDSLNMSMGMSLGVLEGVGIVIPGLIANCFYKQGIKLTTVSTLGVSFAAFVILNVAQLV